MQLSLRSPARKGIAGALVAAAAVTYCGFAASRMLAHHLDQSSDINSLRHAARLDPGNAEIRHNLGMHQLAMQSPDRARPWLRSAAALNPNSARYWIDLALTEQLLGNPAGEKAALDKALEVDPHTPAVAWQAANLFLAQGMTGEAMKQFHTVLANDVFLTSPALNTAWAIRPDADFLLAKVVPPAANVSFLQFLLSKGETAAASKVWQRIFSLQQEIDRPNLLAYERYLISHGDSTQASLVWQQAAALANIAAYQPSAENLFVNGDFSLDILNGGFDWVHQPTTGVSIALDAGETRSGSRSLRIVLDGSGISDAGISQLVKVASNARYEFTAFYKAKEMDGAGAVRFAVHDAYRGTPLFVSSDLRDVDFWKNSGGTFETAADTQLIRVHVVRDPPGRPIRGKLWIDGLRLVKVETEKQ